MLTFDKYEGAGNDFVLIDSRTLAPAPWPELAQALCARHWGVGADGLLVLLPSEQATVRMRMFNPDGTEDMCGNGLRCVALHVREHGLAGTGFDIETLAGLRQVRILECDAGRALVQVEMGRAELDPACIPMEAPGPQVVRVLLPVGDEVVTLTALNTGSTHAVIFGPLPEEERFQRLSGRIERHAAFPERTSVIWAAVDGEERARVRIWERGVGETLACGTGACAVAVAGILEGLLASPVTVQSPGGELRVDVAADLSVRLTGEARRVFTGVWQG